MLPDESKEVLDPMTHFPQQQVLSFASLLEFRDVARDF